MSFGSLCAVLLVLTVAGATDETLLGPCREWIQPCLEARWVCGSEEQYWRSRQLGCPVREGDPPPPPPGLKCRVINGTCQYTNSDLECATWVPDCHFSYTCGSVQERQRTANSSNCGPPLFNPPPLPDELCLPINNTCQWYNPCRYWRGHCLAPYYCGTADQFYMHQFGPQPLCALPLEGWVEPQPPGECVVRDQSCQWSNCTAYLDWCNSHWTCGTQYDHAVYYSSPPPPCPPPPPDHMHNTPTQPGVCRFSLQSGHCEFFEPATTSAQVPTPTTPYIAVEDACVLGIVQCPADDECVPDPHHPRGAYCLHSRDVTTQQITDPDPCYGPACREDQICEVDTVGCGPNSDYCRRYPSCKNPPYVPCGSDAFLACDSEWTYCLQQNKTRRASCVSSCFSRNGNCGESVCITSVPDDRGTPRTQCVEPDDLPKDCPAGQVINECGNLCQETCDHVVQSESIGCADVCGPPACECPYGLVLFRDRCVDPRLCYVLLKYPPAIQPLPVVDSHTVLLSLHSDSLIHMDRQQFTEQHQRSLLDDVQRILSSNGHNDVQVSFHGIHLDQDQNQIQIVIRLSGDSISRSTVADLVQILSQNSHSLGIPIQEVSDVQVEHIGSDLSESAIIGIAVSSGVAGIALIVAWIAVLTCCCVLRKRHKTTPPPYSEGVKSNAYTNVIFDEKDLSKDSEKDKMLMESS